MGQFTWETLDTLNGLLLAEIAYGYGVVSILHQKPPNAVTWMPSDDIRLAIGDRLIVLATIAGLQRVELGRLDLASKRWQIHLERAAHADAIFEGANTIARISGCHLSLARNLMNNLPQTLPVQLYYHQGQRLVRELSKVLVKAQLVSLS